MSRSRTSRTTEPETTEVPEEVTAEGEVTETTPETDEVVDAEIVNEPEAEVTETAAEDEPEAIEGEVVETAPANGQKGKGKKEFVLTPYQATKLMNMDRRRLGLKEVNSPMLYIMAGKGKFIITITADGRKEVDTESFYAWMVAHNARQVSLRDAKAQPAIAAA
jgi:hypothetical protein